MTDIEKDKLWKKYRETRSVEVRNEIIVEYAPLVKIVAGRLTMYLNNNIEYDDLVSYGILGLIDAIDKFDSTKNVKFETYATLRIRGAIIDQIRKLDWMPRTLRDKQKLYNKTEEELTSRLGRKPTDSELIDKLGVSEDEYYLTQSNLLRENLISMDDDSQNRTNDGQYSLSDTLKQSTFISPDENVLREELSNKLSVAMNKLSDKQRKVIELYYYNDMTFKEIREILEVSQSRVSQLHARALCILKEQLGEYMDLIYKEI